MNWKNKLFIAVCRTKHVMFVNWNLKYIFGIFVLQFLVTNMLTYIPIYCMSNEMYRSSLFLQWQYVNALLALLLLFLLLPLPTATPQPGQSPDHLCWYDSLQHGRGHQRKTGADGITDELSPCQHTHTRATHTTHTHSYTYNTHAQLQPETFWLLQTYSHTLTCLPCCFV